MPKPWDEREKDLVRKALLEEGRKLFEKYGLQKTTVDEIVRAALISKGSFYLFYRSKEELYFDILETVEHEFKDKLFGEVFAQGTSGHESFKGFLRRLIDLLITTPIYSRLNSSDYEYLMRKLPEESLQKHMEHDQDISSRYFQQWMDQGLMRRVDLEALNGVLFSLFYFVMHRDDFSEMNFPAARELWVDILATYLVPEEEDEKKAQK